MRDDPAGFPEVAKPEGDRPLLPEDITLLDGEGLMHLYRELVVWADYATDRLARAAAAEKEEAQALDYERNRAFLRARKQDYSVTDARAWAANEVQEDVSKYAERKALEAVLSSLERDIMLVSRELSRRLGEKSGPVVRRRAFGG